jgi:hypothetical protein
MDENGVAVLMRENVRCIEGQSKRSDPSFGAASEYSLDHIRCAGKCVRGDKWIDHVDVWRPFSKGLVIESSEAVNGLPEMLWRYETECCVMRIDVDGLGFRHGFYCLIARVCR